MYKKKNIDKQEAFFKKVLKLLKSEERKNKYCLRFYDYDLREIIYYTDVLKMSEELNEQSKAKHYSKIELYEVKDKEELMATYILENDNEYSLIAYHTMACKIKLPKKEKEKE